MKKYIIYFFLLSIVSLNTRAIEADREPASDRFVSCFIDDSSEFVCWQQMQRESNPAVRYDYGAHYANGDGVKQDFSKGRYWIHHAALKDFPLAQYNLGIMFFDGIGGTQSKECAIHWLTKAAANDGEIRNMAQQALSVLSELTVSARMPKVYRVFPLTECEKLPDTVSPGGKVEPTQSEEISGGLSGADEMEPSQDVPATFSPRLDVLESNLTADPNDAMQSLSIEPEPSPLLILREKMGQYFIQLGYRLLGKKLSSEKGAVHPNMNDEPGLNPPRSVDMIAIDPHAVEVTESTVKLSEIAELEVVLSLPADETGALASPKREENTLPAPTPVQAPESTEAADTESPKIVPGAPEKTVPRTLNLGGALHNAPKGHFTLQLASADQAEPLQALARKHKLSNYLVYETQRHGRRWYVLVYGEYAGMTQAKQALLQLPSTVKRNTPWIRSLAHVHTEI